MQYALNSARIRDFDIPIPPISEQHRIVAEVERRLSVAQQVEAGVQAQLARAARLRQAVLKAAFEGRLARLAPRVEHIQFSHPMWNGPDRLELFD